MTKRIPGNTPNPRGGNFRQGGRGQRQKYGTMNKMERDWSEVLNERIRAGTVVWWTFTGLTLKLAEDARYTPDFAVQLPGGEIVLHEVKGFMEEAAFVRAKVCASAFPFRLFVITRQKKSEGGAFVESEVRA